MNTKNPFDNNTYNFEYYNTMNSSLTFPEKTAHTLIMESKEEILNEQLEKIKIERDILKFLTKDKNIFNVVILPIISFFCELNMEEINISSIIHDAFYNEIFLNYEEFGITFTEFSFDVESIDTEMLSLEVSEFVSKSQTKEPMPFDYKNFYQAICAIPGLSADDKLLLSSTILKVNRCKSSIRKAYINFIIEKLNLTFVKIFVRIKNIDTIKKNEFFFKLINNAFKKYNDLDTIASLTYDIFVDSVLTHEVDIKDDMTLDTYTDILSYLYISYQEIQEQLDIDKLITNHANGDLNIYDFIVNNKLYNNYNFDELIYDILFYKAKHHTSLNNLINDIATLPIISKKIKNLKITEELLNYENDQNFISINDIDLMSGIQFENFLCNYFTDLGYNCKQTKASGDQGIDLIISKGKTKIAIQAKCYTSTVGNHAIMEAVAGIKFYNATQCMVITNRNFTKAAEELAKANNVILWDRKILIEKLNNFHK